MGLGTRIKAMGLMPDVGKLTESFEAKFGELRDRLDTIIERLDTLIAQGKDQAGQVGIILGVGIVILVLALIGLLAVCTPGENDHGDSLGRVQLISHDRGGCYDEYDCDDYGRRGCDERGCYEEGPPDDRDRGGKQTCFMACYITVPGVPGMGGDQPPPRERASLFPPTPDKIIGGIQVMGDAGIKLGSTIAQLVIDYVVTVFRFIV